MSAARRVRLSDDQRLAWLRLIRSDNVGPITFRELINHFGTAVAALEAVPELAERGGRRIRLCSAAEAEREMAALADRGGRFVAMGEPDYPSSLRHVDDAPPLLAVRGDPSCLAAPIIGIVGSRNASVAGRKFAALIARGLGEAGYTITSGLARGIDAAAHEASLASGTIAVLAGGLDHVYPPENIDLAERIVDGGGAHISEMPMGHEPRGRDFPRRNRIISGTALAIVVVEAAERSGSLITARRAADQGRLVFAVPGSPLDPRAEGGNALIQQGARLITGAADIIDTLSEADPSRRLLFEPDWVPEVETGTSDQPPGDEERERLLAALSYAPVAVDELIRATGVSVSAMQTLLLGLDLEGRIEWSSGQLVALRG